MNDHTRSALAELNRAFYVAFADDFARTRRGWPPGFERILPHLGPVANVLDAGCGNGRLLAFLQERGWRGRYLGVDSSTELLAVATEKLGLGVPQRDADKPPDHAFPLPSTPVGVQSHARFRQADLLSPEWTTRIDDCTPDVILCLAVLHHIPGAAYRARLVAECAGLLRPGGMLILSVWQFFNVPRLQARILPWLTIGLKDDDVEPGDHLVAWGTGAAGQRYCAAITCDALCDLATKAGLSPVETFYADGHERNLNLYGIFRRS